MGRVRFNSGGNQNTNPNQIGGLRLCQGPFMLLRVSFSTTGVHSTAKRDDRAGATVDSPDGVLLTFDPSYASAEDI